MALSTGRKVLLTAAGPHMRLMLESYSLPKFRDFATAHGYELVVELIHADGPKQLREARMFKPRLIRQQLEQGADLVFWVDADALVLRTDADPAELLGSHHFQAFVMEHVPLHDRFNPNSGVWLMRNVPAAHAFLDEVERIGLHPGERWADQAAVMRALGWHMGDPDYVGARPGPSSPAMNGTCWLPTTFNVLITGHPRLRFRDGMEVVNNPHIWHLAGLSVEERLSVLATWSGNEEERDETIS